MEKIAYKIEDKDVWAKAQAKGFFEGSAVDFKDGFIHLSTLSQSQATLDKHFANRNNLIIAKIDLSKIEDGLKWEPSRGGELFPHYYGDLDMNAVIDVFDIVKNNNKNLLPTNL